MSPHRFPEWNGNGDQREENTHFEFIQIYGHEWIKCDRDKHIGRCKERVRWDFNSTRNGNREAEIILSSREGFPRVICVRSFFELYGRIRVLACVPSVHSANSRRALYRCSFQFGGIRIHSLLSVCGPRWRGSPATCWSFVINCLHDMPIVEQFVALLPPRKLCFLEFICHLIVIVIWMSVLCLNVLFIVL